jgi:hypothetical protein
MKKKIVSYLLALSLVVTGFICVDTVNIRAVDDAVVEKAVVELESVEVDSVEEDTIVTVGELVQDTVKVEPVEEVIEEIPIEERIRRACEHYYVPFDIVLAIARLETGWFKSDAYVYKNNPGGLSVNEVPISFDTIEEGVEAFVRNLSKNYFGKGLDTVEEIGRKYCPVNYDHWVWSVNSLIERGQ